MDVLMVLYAAGACAGAGGAGALALLARAERASRIERKRSALRGAGAHPDRRAGTSTWEDLLMRYMGNLGRGLFVGTVQAVSPAVRAKQVARTRSGKLHAQLAAHAGCSKDVTPSAFCEARARLALAGGLSGAFLGVAFSNEMALAGALLGAFAGRALPVRALRAMAARRALQAERSLSEMLEVVALGLRSGLTFDRSFGLYGSHFDSEFAVSCGVAHRRWTLGLASREEALRLLAASYDCDQLGRVVDVVVRGLRFGTSLVEGLEEAAVQSREAYRTLLAERVAKAPVKMMLPTGTLILPAMLLLVLGPILLELAEGF